MKIRKVDRDTELAEKLLTFVENCSWIEVRDHTAETIRRSTFTDWETMLAAVEDGKIVGMAAVLKEDYYPLKHIFPWVSCIFVTEEARRRGICGKLIDHANAYLKEQGFERSYIPSPLSGVYERYGYTRIGDIVNYNGDTDGLFEKTL